MAAAQLLDPKLLDPLGSGIRLHVCPADVVFVRDDQ